MGIQEPHGASWGGGGFSYQLPAPTQIWRERVGKSAAGLGGTGLETGAGASKNPTDGGYLRRASSRSLSDRRSLLIAASRFRAADFDYCDSL